MRGAGENQDGIFRYLFPAARVPQDHPLRPIKKMVNQALSELWQDLEAMYAKEGRPSIPPEKLLRVLLLQALYTIRSERLLMEQLDYNIEAWASLKSFRPKDNPPPAGGAGRNPEVDFHGERRLNQTHASSTDPEARLFRKGKGKEAKLCFMGHVLMENRHGLIISPRLTAASGAAERETAEELVSGIPGRHRLTVGGDKAYDTREFVQSLRALKALPHVAQNRSGRSSAIDGRTTRHPGYAVSQRLRKRVEEIFGWIKTVGNLRKTRHRGIERVGWMFTFTAAAYNLVRIRNLMSVTSP